MDKKTHEVRVFGEEATLTLMYFNKKDGREWKQLFDKWKDLKLGLREYGAREPNMPEGLSEVAFCLWSGSGRFLSMSIKDRKIKVAKSFDTFNVKTQRAEQIKATSIKEDLTSFGPKSRWDDLYFLDFYNQGKLDGTFNVFLIPSKLIYEHKINKTQTFTEQQDQKRRPRLSLTKNFEKWKIKPIATNVKIWN